jgi:hypothetical protein
MVGMTKAVRDAIRAVAPFALGAVLTQCSPASGSSTAQTTSGAGTAVTNGTGNASGGDGSGTGGSSSGAANGTSGAGGTTSSVGGAGTGGSISIGPFPGGGPGCAQQAITFEPTTPTVELVVDRSASMTAAFGALDRWNTIRNILVDPTQGFVSLMQDKVRFGLSLYTALSAEDLGGPSCPNLIQVPIALNNHQPIYDVFVATEVGNNTPTGESLVATTAKLEAFTEIGPKAIVLATDGDPDTCADPDSNGTDPPRILAEMAVQAAWDKGIKTYVIAVGDEITDLQHLQTLADIGSGADPNAMYYPAEDANALASAFGAILAALASCDLSLNGTVDPSKVNTGSVSVSGVQQTYGTGWDMPDPSTLRLLGAACDTFKLGPGSIDIQFPCGAFVVQ